MPLYSYQALDSKGKKRRGLIEATSRVEAKEKLRSQGIMVVDIGIKESATSKENLRGDDLLTFTIQLSQLLNSGVPLYESLLAVEEQYRGEPYHRVILSLCDQIKSGKPLSRAMAMYPESFNQMYCAMIQAGESAGALDEILERLSELILKESKLKKQVATAMIYPSLLSGFAILAVSLLMFFVIPMIQGIFEGRELNFFTRMVFGTSNFLTGFWWVYLPLLIGGGFFLFFRLRTPEGKIWLERLFLKLPIVKQLVIQAAMARFCRTMGTLQKGGLTLSDSLKISRQVISNITLEKEIERAEGKIIEGSSLSYELSKSPWVPPMVSRMLAVGEEAGNTEVMLNKIADMYEYELEKTIERLLALAQPIILVVMGTVVAIIIMSVMIPLTDVSSFTM